jgi:hypothetical protein
VASDQTLAVDGFSLQVLAPTGAQKCRRQLGNYDLAISNADVILPFSACTAKLSNYKHVSPPSGSSSL